MEAARELGLGPGDPARVVAHVGGDVEVLRPDAALPADARLAGGTVEPVEGLPHSAQGARTALRFTADDTPADPGPRVVHAADLGGLELLAVAVDSGAEPTSDLDALLRADREHPHLLRTLIGFTAEPTVRAAAAALYVHHSTLQDRLDTAERALGWKIRTQQGRLRLQLALAERLLRR